MALSLGLKEGDSFYVEDTKVTCTLITSMNTFKLQVDGAMLQVFDIGESYTAQILPQVNVCSKKSDRQGWAYVVIEAPRSIKILREELYLGGRSNGASVSG